MLKKILYIILLLALIKSIFYQPHSINYIYWDKIYFYGILAMALIVTSLLCINYRKKGLTLSRIDVILVFILLYIILNAIISGRFQHEEEALSGLLLILIVWILLKQLIYYGIINPLEIQVLIILACCLLGIHGLLNYMQSGTTAFIGNLGNPNLFSLVVLTGLPASLGWILYLNSTTTLKKITALASVFNIVLTTYSAVFNLTRTAILCILALVSIMLFFRFRNWVIKWSRFGLSLTVLTGLGILLAFSVKLFEIKRPSAEGRILISRITAGAIWEKPITGFGFNSFKHVYPGYQEGWFRRHPSTKESKLSSDVNHSFNEYTQIFFELGLAGVVLAIILFHQLVKSSLKQKDTFQQCFQWGTLVLVLCGSLFYNFLRDYDLATFTLIPILLFPSPALPGIPVSRFWIPIIMGIIAIGFIIIIYLFQYKNAQEKWREINLSENKQEDLADHLKKMDRYLMRDGQYLFNIGGLLYLEKNYSLSKDYLDRARKKYTHSLLLIYSGNVYYALGKKDSAFYFYEAAKWMVPGRLLPRNKIINYYLNAGDTLKAKLEASELIKMKIKGVSPIIKQILENSKATLSY
ncbi:MAG TPA: O-antigen ligase family protein [Chitinophagaceae bacterium]|nr:O-antigen ligase family protein [Chitinophagaceae bacterium]